MVFKSSGLLGSSGGSGATITSPNSTITVGGTTTNPTVDINLANANAFTGWQSNTPETLVISTLTFTPTNGAQNYAFTLNHSTSNILANPSTTPVAGTSGMFIVTQSSSGSDLIGTWGSSYQAAGGTANITLSTLANAVDLIPYYVISSTIIALGGVVRGISH